MQIKNAHIKDLNIRSTPPVVATPLFDMRLGTNWADATFSGNPASTNNYRVFTGSEYITTSNIDTTTLSDDDYTQEIWLRTTGSNNGCVLAKLATGGYHVSAIEINNGNLYAGYWGGASPLYYNFGAITRDAWQHYTITYNTTSGVIEGYINGVSTGDAVLGPEISPRDYGSNPMFYQLFNYESTSFGAGGTLACDFGEFRLYTRALTAQEVAQNFNATRSRWGI